MSKRLIILILAVVVALFVISEAALASDPVYINSAQYQFDGLFSELYAIGSEGVSLIGSNEVYALTGSGLALIGSEENYLGGGGLVYEDGETEIQSNVVKVGLRYYYSENRDSTMASANLENAVGRGYAFGYYDEDRVFWEMSRTDEIQITMRPIGSTGIGVYITNTDILLYQTDYTDSQNMLAVHPLCEDDEAVTWFRGNKYYGDFEYAVLGGAGITVINTLDIERYVMGVCANEMNDSWPLEALKAQAVAARTYVQKHVMSSVYYSLSGFDVTNDTYCQAYNGCTLVGENIREAVLSTANQYVTYKGELIDALYFSSDGGATEDNRNVNGNSAHPYLRGVYDPYEEKVSDINAYSSWTVQLTPAVLASKLGLRDVVEYTVVTSATGNVIELGFRSSNGQSVTLQRDNCRTSLGLFSLRYDVSVDERTGNFVFEGSGWGHNLGMSQYGAYSMAEYYYKTYKDILGFYYTGVGLSYGVINYEEIGFLF